MEYGAERFKNYLNREAQAIKTLDLEAVSTLLELLEKTRKARGRIYTCGNGGSSATASHFVNDFNKMVSDGVSPKYDFICLSDNTSTLMAISNDVCYEECFSYQLEGRITKNDVLIAISGSGNSPNVLKAAETAREIGAVVVGLTGYDGGRLKDMSDISLHVNVNNMQIAEDVHMIMGHMIMSVMMEGREN